MPTATPSPRSAAAWLAAPPGPLAARSTRLFSTEEGEPWTSPLRNDALGVDDALPGDVGVVEVVGGVRGKGGEMFEADADLSWTLGLKGGGD